MDFIGKALAPDGTAADETEGAEETELGGDFWDDFLSASPFPHRANPSARRLRKPSLEWVSMP